MCRETGGAKTFGLSYGAMKFFINNEIGPCEIPGPDLNKEQTEAIFRLSQTSYLLGIEHALRSASNRVKEIQVQQVVDFNREYRAVEPHSAG